MWLMPQVEDALESCALLTKAAGMLAIPLVSAIQNAGVYGALMPEIASVCAHLSVLDSKQLRSNTPLLCSGGLSCAQVLPGSATQV